jgi:transposase
VKARADAVLGAMSARRNAMYAEVGRPSKAPERLLRFSLLVAFYPVRSDQLSCEMLDYHVLFRRFLEMSLGVRAFDHSTFSKNRTHLIVYKIAKEFFCGGDPLGARRAFTFRGALHGRYHLGSMLGERSTRHSSTAC